MQQPHRSPTPLLPRVLSLSIVLVATALGCAVGVSPTGADGTESTATDDAGKTGSLTPDGGGKSSEAGSKISTSTDTDADTTANDAGGTTDDASSAGADAATACPGYALPTESAPCHACQQTSTTCQANGCYGGYYCNLSSQKCQTKPSGC